MAIFIRFLAVYFVFDSLFDKFKKRKRATLSSFMNNNDSKSRIV
ncbi:hypothetical protein RC62_457 [Flavobacterium aquidurense]|uniref:Uncharacterized protein n=1 Tax=Flavobacterium aquidurense TaxID=362413 RepID=A0A0N8VMX8_9FLAO|nr:hypothetical protein RC62_457 [Flavobacterium aquidurense]